MTKFFKKFAAVIAVLMTVVCLAVFAAACDKTGGDDSGDYATDTFTVIVKDENGNRIDGTSDIWEHDQIPGYKMNAAVQFCAVIDDANNRLGSCIDPVNIDENGEAVIDVTELKASAARMGTDLYELHICNVECQGYTKGEYNAAYKRWNVNKIPLVIEVTLKLAADVE